MVSGEAPAAEPDRAT